MTEKLKTQAQILAILVLGMWTLQVVNGFSGNALIGFGIVPRQLVGLRGIIFSPFLHGGFNHLLANTLPFVILGWLVMVRRISDFLKVSLVVMGVGGLGTWLFAGPNTVTIGASGLVFGYLGYLIFRGIFEQSFIAIAVSLGVGIVYGGMLWGILPAQPHISWQGHLFGFIGGGLAARWFSKPQAKSRYQGLD
ncbi:MAG: rhomboid family intramembrane serine protease [Acaryochloridaceae cyanobacterium SU_2_1]|nr:rhomboid family intramembrane serine protease [Acaryochloridaceae cyanobacterium SU_2_1]